MARQIFVFGSPGSGKSVFSAALAKEVQKHQKKAIIVSGDTLIPMLPYFCGNCDTMVLGTLCAGDITPQKIAQAVKVLKDHPNIGVMGLQFEDDLSGITEERLWSISEYLDDMVDVVIWDGTSDVDSVIDRAMLKKADLQVCILTADVRGILYYEQYRAMIQDMEQGILLEGMSKPYSPYEELYARAGGLFGRLYYGREIERVCLEGKVFSVDQVCHEKYKEQAEKIVDLVFTGKEE